MAAQINKAEWHDYFDRMSKTLLGKSAEIDIEALELGSQVEARWTPLLGIVYEPRGDVMSVLLEGLNHLIHHPQVVFVEEVMGELRSIMVNDSDAYQHIIKLRDPLLLPTR